MHLPAHRKRNAACSSWMELVRLPLGMSMLLASANFAVQGHAYASAIALTSWFFLYPQEFSVLITTYAKLLKQFGWNSYLMLGVIVGVVIGGGLFLILADPASAQFFGTTEQWMKTALNLDDTLVGLVFNTLRGIFVLYIGISIVQVVQKAREGDDWQTLARTPLIIVVAVTLGDTLAGLVTGQNGGAAT